MNITTIEVILFLTMHGFFNKRRFISGFLKNQQSLVVSCFMERLALNAEVVKNRELRVRWLLLSFGRSFQQHSKARKRPVSCAKIRFPVENIYIIILV